VGATVEVAAMALRSVTDALDTDVVVVALEDADALVFCETDPVIVELEEEATVEKLDTPEVEVERVALNVIEMLDRVEADAVDDKFAETDVIEEISAIEEVVLTTVIVADAETFRILEGPLVLDDRSLEDVEESKEVIETLALTLSIDTVEVLLSVVEVGLCIADELVDELLRSEAVLVKLVFNTEAELGVGPSVDDVERISELDEVLEVS
jgi:hypothetical protein